MNEHFINVKVDREERPDVDKVYMSFVQASTGSGGWPMSVFMTPNLKPVFGGTYFPPEDQVFGRPGFKTILQSLANQWQSKQDKLMEAGEKIIEAMGEQDRASSGSESELKLGGGTLQKCFAQLVKSYEPNMGGFSRAPKFPQPVNFNFLFRFAADEKTDGDHSKQALKMVLHTLDMMSKGGIFDHVSKGFARYSTDERWHVPHFEKMLYDQGQLCVAFAQAFQASGDPKFKRVLNDVIEYVARDLTHADGGFYSAEDADSLPESGSEHKKEGAFCVWTFDELKRLLIEQKKVDVFAAVFGAKPEGNVNPRGDPHGELKNQNVLTRIDSDPDKIILEFGLKDRQELEAIIEECRVILYQVRQSRPRPHLDDKILTAWNGLMISGLCAAANALGNQEHLKMALKAAQFIKETSWSQESKVLYRSAYRGSDGAIHQLNPPIKGFVDDYAFVIRALIDLYEATFDCSWLEWALELQLCQNELFWDPEQKGYFTSAAGDESIVLRMKGDQDGAEPSANSVSVLNLLRLSMMLDKPEFLGKAKETMAAFQDTLARFPVALPEMATGLMMLNSSPPQIIITGDPKTSPETKSMIEAVHSFLLPQKVLILADGNKDSVIYKSNKVVRDIPVDKPGQAFVCRNFACLPPISDPKELVALLSKKWPISCLII